MPYLAIETDPGPPIVVGLKDLITAPAEYIDEIEAVRPGWTNAQLQRWSAWIDSRLRKRYAAPFSPPYPDAVTGWLAAIMDRAIYRRRGVDPTDEEVKDIFDAADTAMAEVKEAADAVNGLFDLPLRADTTDNGISKGAPLAYSEPTAYGWLDVQRSRVDGGEW